MSTFSRHIVGFAVITAAVVNVLIEKFEAGWPSNAQQWTLLLLAALAALCAGVIGYRAPFGGSGSVPLSLPAPGPSQSAPQAGAPAASENTHA